MGTIRSPASPPLTFCHNNSVGAHSARCNPIDEITLRAMKTETAEPHPIPIKRREAAPDGEFLALSADSKQPGPLGPIPKLNEEAKGQTIASVVPEYKVHQTALMATTRGGEDAARAERSFQKVMQLVGERSVMRFSVAKSPIQVCVCSCVRVCGMAV